MSQLYSRVFLRILDSSIAENFELRHVFEDFLKLSEDGIIDVTREALSRRLNIPIDLLNSKIAQLESPDPNSRDPDFEGRRLERLDEHRDWGWRILNWEKFESIKTKAMAAERQARRRKRVSDKLDSSTSKLIPEAIQIPKELDTAAFKTVWAEWIEHLKQKKKPATRLSVDRQLRKLLKLGVEKAIITLNHCIEHNWQGIYEPTNNGTGGSASGKPNPRNFGIAIGPTDYATAKPRLQRQREAAEKAGVAGQVATSGIDAPKTGRSS